MNERIRELMAQAGFDPSAIERMGIMPQAEKFAELIVRECADIAWKDSVRYATVDNNTIMNGKADVLALCSHHIKQHFGVEE